MNGNQKFTTRQHMLTREFEAFYYVDRYMKSVELHHHDFYELYFFQSGEVSYSVENRTFALLPGDILLISPDELHQPIFTDSDAAYSRIVLWLHPQLLNSSHVMGDGTVEEWHLERCFDIARDNHTNLLRLPAQESRALFELAMSVVELQFSDEPLKRMRMRIDIARILLTLNEVAPVYIKNAAQGSYLDMTLASITAYINENLARPLTLQSIADAHFISRSHLAHRFKQLTGTSVYRYITQRRLIKAKELLISGDTANIAKNCGFSDYSGFYRAFKTEYGMSPRAYAAEMGKIRPSAAGPVL